MSSLRTLAIASALFHVLSDGSHAQRTTGGGDQFFVVVSMPSGVKITANRVAYGRTPVRVKRVESEWSHVMTPMQIRAEANQPGQCSQIRALHFDQATPDTMLFEMSKCPSPDQDFSRIFELEELEQGPEIASLPRMDYPDVLRNAGIEGFVLIDIVIDATGRVDPATLQVLVKSHDGFVPPASDAALHAKYKPGLVLGRKVRSHVQIPVNFRIRDCFNSGYGCQQDVGEPTWPRRP